jgi:hypothetical protein
VPAKSRSVAQIVFTLVVLTLCTSSCDKPRASAEPRERAEDSGNWIYVDSFIENGQQVNGIAPSPIVYGWCRSPGNVQPSFNSLAACRKFAMESQAMLNRYVMGACLKVADAEIEPSRTTSSSCRRIFDK